MPEERRRILNLLADGKITAAEAERLLDALAREGSDTEQPQRPEKKKPRFLHVQVEARPGTAGDVNRQHGGENVNIRVPLTLLRAGIRMGSVIPERLRGKVTERLAEHGIQLDPQDLDRDQLEALIEALSETSIDIDSDRERVRIYCA